MINGHCIYAMQEVGVDIRPYTPPPPDARPTYVHVLPGRARVRIPLLQRSAHAARHVRQALLAQEGVLTVEVNPATGGVLIHYDQDRASAQGLLALACSAAMASGPFLPSRRAVGLDRGRVLQIVLATCLKLAVEATLARAIGAPVRGR